MKHLPQIYYEKAALGEASPEELEALRADPELAKKIEALQAANAVFLREHPAWTQVPQFKKNVSTKAANTILGTFSNYLHQFGFRTALGILSFTVLVFFLAPSFVDNEETRIKGSQSLRLYRQKDGKIEELRAGISLSAFESVQLAYQAGSNAYGIIFSVDGRGTISLHYPPSWDASPILEQGREISLDFAYQLDDAPNFERFYFVTSKNEFSVTDFWDDLNIQITQIVQKAPDYALGRGVSLAARAVNLVFPRTWTVNTIEIIKKTNEGRK